MFQHRHVIYCFKASCTETGTHPGPAPHRTSLSSHCGAKAFQQGRVLEKTSRANTQTLCLTSPSSSTSGGCKSPTFSGWVFRFVEGSLAYKTGCHARFRHLSSRNLGPSNARPSLENQRKVLPRQRTKHAVKKQGTCVRSAAWAWSMSIVQPAASMNGTPATRAASSC